MNPYAYIRRFITVEQLFHYYETGVPLLSNRCSTVMKRQIRLFVLAKSSETKHKSLLKFCFQNLL